MNCATDEDIDVMKPDDGKNVFHQENISFDSTKINWDEIKKEGKRIKHFYVELSDVKDMSIRQVIWESKAGGWHLCQQPPLLVELLSGLQPSYKVFQSYVKNISVIEN